MSAIITQEHKKHKHNLPGAVLTECVDYGIHSAGEITVVRVDLKHTHIHPFETIHAEQSADNGGVNGTPDPHKQVVTILQQEQTVGGESVRGEETEMKVLVEFEMEH